MVFPDDFAPGAAECFTTTSSTVWHADNIIFIFSHPNTDHTLEDAKLANSYIDNILNGTKATMLCDVRQAKPMHKEVRNYYNSEEGTRNCNRFAFIVSSSFSRVIANFFIGFSNLKYPVKMFTSPQSAIDWSNSFSNEGQL